MNAQDEFSSRNDLDEFLRRVRSLMDEFPQVREAEVEVMVPEDVPLAKRSDLFALEAAGGCNCPAGTRCVRLFPSGRRVCVPR